MKQKTNASIFLAILMMVSIVACKPKEKTDEPATAEPAKSETVSIPDFDPAMDATKVPGYPVSIFGDSLNLKAYEFLANPGDIIPMHSHPDHVIYVLEGGKAEITGKDGKANEVDFKKGACIISGPQNHSAKNIGTTPLKLLIVHVYRPRS